MDFYRIVRDYLNARLLLKRVLGGVCIILGLVALVAPILPGAWLIFIGLELAGVRMLVPDRWKFWRRGR